MAGVWPRHTGGFLSDAVLVPRADHMLMRLPTDLIPVLACGVADNISDGRPAVAPHLRSGRAAAYSSPPQARGTAAIIAPAQRG